VFVLRHTKRISPRNVCPRTTDPNHRPQPPTTNHRPPSSAPPTETLRQWGLRTLGEFAALASDEVAARLGQAGVWWQRIARGEDPAPLVAAVPEERFEQALDLEWPIEGLEPLSFVLGRLMEPLSTHLERRDRGAAVLHVRLHLVTRTVHERTLQLPVAMRDPRALRTLALLDLESNPPSAAIDRVVVAVDPTPGRIVQYSLLARPLPSPEQISTLMARLTALMGEGHCGAPAVVDSWRSGVFAMQPFAPREVSDSHSSSDTGRRGGGEIEGMSRLHASIGDRVSNGDSHLSNETQRYHATETKALDELPASTPPRVVRPVNDLRPVITALRRFRFPVPARVHVENGKPVRVVTDRRGLHGGRVEACAGPWRTSGGWWQDDASARARGSLGADGVVRRSLDENGPVRRSLGGDGPVRRSLGENGPVRRSLGEGGWDCDEWDVTLADGATYRLSRARDVDQWCIDGILD